MSDTYWNNDLEMWEACIDDQVCARGVNYWQTKSIGRIDNNYGTNWPTRVSQAAERIAKKLGKAVKKGRLDSAIFIAKAVKWEVRGEVLIVLGSEPNPYRIQLGAECLCPDRESWCKHKLAHAIILEARKHEHV